MHVINNNNKKHVTDNKEHVINHVYTFRMDYYWVPFGVGESRAKQIFAYESQISHGGQYRGGKVIIIF